MAELNVDKMAKKVAEKALDYYVYQGKTIREWIAIIAKNVWIPVSERLPEKEGLYLVSVKNEHDRRYSKTCWFHGNGNWFARQDVIAWMPLPESYMEGENK